MSNIRNFYPQVNLQVDSLQDVPDIVVDVAADVVIPGAVAGTPAVINVGNAGSEDVVPALSNDSVTIVDGELVVTDLSLSVSSRIGDTVEIELPGPPVTTLSRVITDINTITGEVYMISDEDGWTAASDQILISNDDGDVTVSVVQSDSVFTGNVTGDVTGDLIGTADMSNQILITDDVDAKTGQKDIIYIHKDVYEADGFSPVDTVLYLIHEDS